MKTVKLMYIHDLCEILLLKAVSYKAFHLGVLFKTDEVLVANINISMNEQCTNTHDEVQDRLYCAALTIGTKSHFWPKHKI